jgi:flavin reductase
LSCDAGSVIQYPTFYRVTARREEDVNAMPDLAVVAEDDAARRTRFLALMRLVPAPVAIIACASASGTSGLAATAWCSLSANPPMMLACVNRSASAHDLIVAVGAFSINVLPESDSELCAIFSGQRGLEGAERFVAGNWSHGSLGQPILGSAVAAFECRLSECHSYGTHTLITGQVEAMGENAGGHALLYADGKYSRLHRQEA